MTVAALKRRGSETAAGKTMLAKRLAGILPPLTFQEAIETTKIHRASRVFPEPERPVRIAK